MTNIFKLSNCTIFVYVNKQYISYNAFVRVPSFYLCFFLNLFFEIFPTETWELFEFFMNPPLLETFPKFLCFLILKASLSYYVIPGIQAQSGADILRDFLQEEYNTTPMSLV